MSLRYDANGNLHWDGLLAYTYDCANELTAVTLTNCWKTGYALRRLRPAAHSERLRLDGNAWAETNEVHYVYDGMNVLQERNSNNVPLVTYTRGVDLRGTRQGRAGSAGCWRGRNQRQHVLSHGRQRQRDGAGKQQRDGGGEYLYDSFGNTLGMWGRWRRRTRTGFRPRNRMCARGCITTASAGMTRIAAVAESGSDWGNGRD